MRKERAADIRTLEDVNNIQSDLSDIKAIITASGWSATPSVVPIQSPKKTMAEVVKMNLSKINKANYSSKNIQGDAKRRGSTIQIPDGSVKNDDSLSTARTTSTSVNQRRPNRRRNVGVIGTKKMTATTGLFSIPKNLDVFVSRCLPDTKSDDIVAFCNDENVKVEKCESISTKISSCESFKVTVRAPDRDRLLDPTFWPEGIVARKFFNASNRHGVARRGKPESSQNTS